MDLFLTFLNHRLEMDDDNAQDNHAEISENTDETGPLPAASADLNPEEDATAVPENLLIGEEEFKNLSTKFFKSCKNPNYSATFSIIKLGITDAEGKSTVKFGAFRNEGAGRKHMEKVFIDWWDSKNGLNLDSECNAVEIYTNYSPCYTCALMLRDWLTDRRRIKLSIYYKFVYFGHGHDELLRSDELEDRISIGKLTDAMIQDLKK